MPGGTLLVSRYVNWFPHFKTHLESLGFPAVHVTAKEKDALNMLINELKPSYFLMGSNFYSCGTPYMVGQLLRAFPNLNIAIVTSSLFPDGIATWFMFHGVRTYIKIADGPEELRHGLQCFLEGKGYVAPDVKEILDSLPEWPKIPPKATERQAYVLLMLCNGFSISCIEECLYVCKATVEHSIRELMKIFNSRGREELIKTAKCLEIFTNKDLDFYDTSFKNIKLPEWAVTQIKINKEMRAKRNEQITMNKKNRAKTKVYGG